MHSLKRLSVWILFVTMLFLLAQNTAHAAICTSTGSGNWSDVGRFDCGVPGSGDDVIIAAGHTVTLDTDVTIQGITVNGVFNNGSNTLTLSKNGPYLTNNGAFNGQMGKYVFAGSGTGGVYGSNAVAFNNVEISVGVDFKGSGAPDNATINGTLALKGGGFVSTNAPYYATGSTLKYDTGGFYQAGTEWKTTATSGAGVPYHVQVSTTFTHLNFQNSGGALRTALGNITIDSGTTFSLSTTGGGGNLAIKGNWTNNGSFNADDKTVTFNGSSGTQTLSGNTTFYNLTIANSGATISFGSTTTTIANTLSKTSGNTMDPGTSTIIFTGAAGSLAGANAKVFYNLQINSGASITHGSGAGNITIDGNYTNDGTFSQNSSLTITFGGTAQSLSGSGATTFGSVTVQGSSTLNSGSHSISVGGTFSASTGGLFDGGTGTVTFIGTPSMGSGQGTDNFNNVTISGTLSNSANKSFNVKGNWTNNGTYSQGTETITFNAVGAQTLNKSGAGSTETFCNLTIASSATLNTGDDMVAVSGGGSCGTLTQSGKLVRTTPSQNITNGGGAVTFTDSRNVNTAIVTQTGGSDMGATTVTVTSNAGAPACGNRVFRNATILRWYDIAPTNVSGVTATVRLYYRTTNPNEANGITPADVRIYHCDGAYWNELGGTTGSDGTGEYVELTGVTTFSPFGLAPQDAPTSAILGRFRAQATPKHQVRVKWNTEAEWNVVGFNLYRQTAGRKKWTKLNGDTPIERKDVTSPNGARYKWNDKQVKAGKTYRYKLEILKVSGPAEWSEVVQVTVP